MLTSEFCAIFHIIPRFPELPWKQTKIRLAKPTDLAASKNVLKDTAIVVFVQ
jgi:hypothetical protein